jgi:hypothetical protein
MADRIRLLENPITWNESGFLPGGNALTVRMKAGRNPEQLAGRLEDDASIDAHGSGIAVGGCRPQFDLAFPTQLQFNRKRSIYTVRGALAGYFGADCVS